MFLPHLAIALAAKRVAPRPHLGTLILAAVIGDSTASIVPLIHISVPFTQSLVGCISWGIVFGHFSKRQDWQGAGWLGLLVVSHWVLDALWRRSDMPLWPDGPIVGFGPWLPTPVALVVELGSLAAGVAVYSSVTRPRGCLGTFSFWAFVAVAGAIGLAVTLIPARGRSIGCIFRTGGLDVRGLGVLDRAPSGGRTKGRSAGQIAVIWGLAPVTAV